MTLEDFFPVQSSYEESGSCNESIETVLISYGRSTIFTCKLNSLNLIHIRTELVDVLLVY